jgi:gas vesicle protein
MSHREEGSRSHRRGGGFLSGFFFGGLVGATLGLVLAPRSGDETRQILRDRSLELRDQVTEGVDEAKASVNELQQRGRDFVEDNKQRIERTAAAVRQTAKETWTADDASRNEEELAAVTTSYSPPY